MVHFSFIIWLTNPSHHCEPSRQPFSRLDGIRRLIKDLKAFLSAMPKARTAKTGTTHLAGEFLCFPY